MPDGDVAGQTYRSIVPLSKREIRKVKDPVQLAGSFTSRSSGLPYPGSRSVLSRPNVSRGQELRSGGYKIPGIDLPKGLIPHFKVQMGTGRIACIPYGADERASCHTLAASNTHSAEVRVG